MIYEYIKSITLLAIFLALLEMILPSMKFTKYIKLVLGFVLMVNIILPFVDFDKYSLDIIDFEDINFTDDKFDYTPYIEASNNLDGKVVGEALKNDIQNSFQSDIYLIKDVVVEYEIKGDNFEFESIEIILEEKGNASVSDVDNKGSDLIKIDTIEVGGLKQETKLELLNIPEIDNLKNKINLEYNVPIASIYVNIINKTNY